MTPNAAASGSVLPPDVDEDEARARIALTLWPPPAAAATVRAGTSEPLRREQIAALLSEGAVRDAVNRQIRMAGLRGATLATPGSSRWPTQLDDLGSGAPRLLWQAGTEDLRPALIRSVAVVGARSATGYGTRVAIDWAADFAEHGRCVVSGGAFGIDAAAHRGAIAGRGTTILVSAGGLDQAYPSAHEELYRRVQNSGLVLTDQAFGARPRRPLFLQRNRLIAALTPGTLVVEAGVRSGALSTARAASALHRLVMGVPGPVTSPMSRGTNALIASGTAVLVTAPDDVRSLIGPLGETLPPEPVGPTDPREALPARQREILERFPARRPVGIDEAAALLPGLRKGDVANDLRELADGGWLESAHGVGAARYRLAAKARGPTRRTP